MIPPWFLFLSAVLPATHGWDRIATRTLKAIFPYANGSDVWRLTYQINRQDSQKAAEEVLNNWLDENWVQPPRKEVPPKIQLTSTTTSYPPSWENVWFMGMTEPPTAWKSRDLSDKEFARSQALAFLDHRQTVRMYLRHMFRAISNDRRIMFSDIQEVRNDFWKADRQCFNVFQCTAPKFVRIAGRRISVPIDALYLYSKTFYKVPPVAEKLDWKLEGGEMAGLTEKSKVDYSTFLHSLKSV